MFDPYTDWILEHYKDYNTCPELVKALNDIFGLNATIMGIKYWFDKRFGMTTVYGHRNGYSKEEEEFVKKYYPDHGPEKTAEMINEIFGSNRSANSVKSLANQRLKIFVNPAIVKNIHVTTCEKMRNVRRKEVGSVRKTKGKNGRSEYKIKIADGDWRLAGIVIWEEANGPIPDGHQIMYLDGDNSNYQLDNLCLVTHKVGYQVQTNECYQSGNPDVIKALIKYYELRNALGLDYKSWARVQKKFERKYGKEFIDATFNKSFGNWEKE